MPHLTVHALESDLSGRESALIEALTDAVVAVYGEWAREIAVVHLIGLPRFDGASVASLRRRLPRRSRSASGRPHSTGRTRNRSPPA